MARRGRRAECVKVRKIRTSPRERNVVIEDMQRHIAKLKRDFQELVREDMWRQIAQLTCQLAKVRSLRDREKRDYRFMASFENSFQRHKVIS